MFPVIFLFLSVAASALATPEIGAELAAVTVALPSTSAQARKQAIAELAEKLLAKLQIPHEGLTNPVGRRAWTGGHKHWVYFRSAKSGTSELFSLSFRHRPTPSQVELGLSVWRGFPEAPVSDYLLVYITNETTGRTLLTLRETDGGMVRVGHTKESVESALAHKEIVPTSRKVLQIDDFDAFGRISDLPFIPCEIVMNSQPTE